ncbi:hypothetical protein [Crateriforma spongiae]|uniref:hypothetical protein n=1 Tax=Crateriforma spongiae TaxID=2724528 RepID=UPI0014482644|nr:hypothetical protein [Crateriforma spongiae]
MPSVLGGCWLCVVAGTLGCGDEGESTDLSGAPVVSVVYREQPLADVEVSLMERVDGAVIAQGVTGSDGKAYFPDLPQPEPQRYFVRLRSLGDGGWMLNQKVVNSLTDTTQLKPLKQASTQVLELPSHAVRTLAP